MHPPVVTIEPVPVALKPLMRTLMNLYFYDLAEFAAPDDWNPDLRDDGHYPNRYFDPYWTLEGIAEGRRPFLIRANGLAAGHIYVNEHNYSGQADRSLAEFFVLRKFRGAGVGRAAAWQVFDQFPGRWEVAQTRLNLPAQAFWRKTIAAYLARDGGTGHYQEVLNPGNWRGPALLFANRAAVPPLGAAPVATGLAPARPAGPPPPLAFRLATPTDAPVLGAMNRQLILAEHNRNPMTVPELIQRMAMRLSPGHPDRYAAVLFEAAGQPIGYVLYRPREQAVYIQQFFVVETHRRQGVAHAALAWLQAHPWQGVQTFQLDVLAGNVPAAMFWHAVGFTAYCTTLEASGVHWR